MAQPIDGRFACQFLERLHAAVNAHDADAVAALWPPPALAASPSASAFGSSASSPAEHEDTGVNAAPGFG